MNQLPLFEEKEPAPPRVVRVLYEGSDFEIAIAEAKKKYSKTVGVIAIPAGLKLLTKKRTVKRKVGAA